MAISSKYVGRGGVGRINETILPVVGMKRVVDVLEAPCPDGFFR